MSDNNEMFGSYEDERIQYTDSTYDIVSKVAYLIGVPIRIFENPHEPPKMAIYNVLDKDKMRELFVTYPFFARPSNEALDIFQRR